MNLRMSQPYILSDTLIIFIRKLDLSYYNEKQELIINNLQRKNGGVTISSEVKQTVVSPKYRFRDRNGNVQNVRRLGKRLRKVGMPTIFTFLSRFCAVHPLQSSPEWVLGALE